MAMAIFLGVVDGSRRCSHVVDQRPLDRERANRRGAGRERPARVDPVARLRQTSASPSNGNPAGDRRPERRTSRVRAGPPSLPATPWRSTSTGSTTPSDERTRPRRTTRTWSSPSPAPATRRCCRRRARRSGRVSARRSAASTRASSTSRCRTTSRTPRSRMHWFASPTGRARRSATRPNAPGRSGSRRS